LDVFPVSAVVKRLAVGVSQHFHFITAAQMRNSTAGTHMETRQAELLSKPIAWNGLKRHQTMKICVTPPPKFPQPAAVAFAVPITFGANMSEHQNWFVTKVAPAHPIIVRIKMKLQSLEIAAEHNTQKAPKDKRQHCVFTGPKRSKIVPSAMRTKIVTPTEPMPE